MAVRDDFAAGEVLAAADLNDTFASKLPYSYGTATPSTTVDGFLWYDENDTPPTPKFWDGSAFQNVAPAGGLSFITTETFSAVSAVNVNSCFTSDYTNYRLLITMTNASTNLSVQMRLRTSGSDNVNNSYSVQSLTGQASSTSASALTSTVFGLRQFDGGVSQAIRYINSLDLYYPQASERTLGAATIRRYDTNSTVDLLGLSFDAATSFDGFSLIASTGNFTGVVSVYGYKD